MTEASLDTFKIIVFAGVQNLPTFAGEACGFFKKRGLQVETTFTRSSEEQRDGLAEGKYHLAHAAIDNAIAMVEDAGKDVAIVIGLDMGFNKLIAQPEIQGYEDLRGKTLGVDAPDTAFALIAYEMLRLKGLNPGDYKVQPVGATRFRLDALKERKIDFAMLNLPFNLFAQSAGLKVLDVPGNLIGAYQSAGGYVMRPWAAQNRALLVRYLAGYIEGLRWAMDPTNRDAAIALLQQRMEIAPDIATACFDQLSDPKTGLVKDALISQPGMKTVLELRARFTGAADAAIPSPAKYIDESFYNEALASI